MVKFNDYNEYNDYVECIVYVACEMQPSGNISKKIIWIASHLDFV